MTAIFLKEYFSSLVEEQRSLFVIMFAPAVPCLILFRASDGAEQAKYTVRPTHFDIFS